MKTKSGLCSRAAASTSFTTSLPGRALPVERQGTSPFTRGLLRKVATRALVRPSWPMTAGFTVPEVPQGARRVKGYFVEARARATIDTRPTMIYSLLRGLARLLLAIFYRRVEVAGLEHVPAAGPLVAVANHHNALIDAALLLAAIPRRLAPVAKAPLFHHPVLGPLLRSVGAIAAHRREEGGTDLARNAALFEHAVARLREGTGIGGFPEGVSHPEPMIRSLRTGSARIVLAAAEAEAAPVTVLPVGLVFYHPGAFRAGSAIVVIGSPVITADLVAAEGRDRAQLVRELTDRIGRALRDLIVEVEDRQTFRLLQLAEALWRDEGPADAAAVTARLQRAARAMRWLRGHEPGRLEGVRHSITVYAGALGELGLGDD